MSSVHTLVIGGSRGLGRVAAEMFLARGDKVSILSRSAVNEPLPAAKYYALDLANGADRAAALKNISSAQGPITNVIFAQRFRGEGDGWEGEIETSLHATKSSIEELAPLLEKKGGAAIVVVGSVYGSRVGDEQGAGYHIVKGALEHLVRYFAVKLGPENIRVNTVSPCTYLKDESKDAYLENEALLGMFAKILPLKNLPTAANVADVIAFLCSPQAAYINGQNITVDGGLSLVAQESLARRLMNLPRKGRPA